MEPDPAGVIEGRGADDDAGPEEVAEIGVDDVENAAEVATVQLADCPARLFWSLLEAGDVY
jgi:hypothetical protein